MQNLKLKIQNCGKGFTLIELLIVIAIIGVLATLLMVNFVGVRQRARDAQRKSDLRQLQSALEIYRSDNGSYPDNTNESLKVSDIFACSPQPSPAACTGSGNCFGNPANSANPACSLIYMKTLPKDPSGGGYNGGDYYYNGSGGSTYILEACLENQGDSQGTSTDPSGKGSLSVCPSEKYFVLYNP